MGAGEVIAAATADGGGGGVGGGWGGFLGSVVPDSQRMGRHSQGLSRGWPSQGTGSDGLGPGLGVGLGGSQPPLSGTAACDGSQYDSQYDSQLTSGCEGAGRPGWRGSAGGGLAGPRSRAPARLAMEALFPEPSGGSAPISQPAPGQYCGIGLCGEVAYAPGTGPGTAFAGPGLAGPGPGRTVLGALAALPSLRQGGGGATSASAAAGAAGGSSSQAPCMSLPSPGLGSEERAGALGVGGGRHAQPQASDGPCLKRGATLTASAAAADQGRICRHPPPPQFSIYDLYDDDDLDRVLDSVSEQRMRSAGGATCGGANKGSARSAPASPGAGWRPVRGRAPRPGAGDDANDDDDDGDGEAEVTSPCKLPPAHTGGSSPPSYHPRPASLLPGLVRRRSLLPNGAAGTGRPLPSLLHPSARRHLCGAGKARYGMAEQGPRRDPKPQPADVAEPSAASEPNLDAGPGRGRDVGLMSMHARQDGGAGCALRRDELEELGGEEEPEGSLGLGGERQRDGRDGGGENLDNLGAAVADDGGGDGEGGGTDSGGMDGGDDPELRAFARALERSEAWQRRRWRRSALPSELPFATSDAVANYDGGGGEGEAQSEGNEAAAVLATEESDAAAAGGRPEGYAGAGTGRRQLRSADVPGEEEEEGGGLHARAEQQKQHPRRQHLMLGSEAPAREPQEHGPAAQDGEEEGNHGQLTGGGQLDKLELAAAAGENCDGPGGAVDAGDGAAEGNEREGAGEEVVIRAEIGVGGGGGGLSPGFHSIQHVAGFALLAQRTLDQLERSLRPPPPEVAAPPPPEGTRPAALRSVQPHRGSASLSSGCTGRSGGCRPPVAAATKPLADFAFLRTAPRRRASEGRFGGAAGLPAATAARAGGVRPSVFVRPTDVHMEAAADAGTPAGSATDDLGSTRRSLAAPEQRALLMRGDDGEEGVEGEGSGLGLGAADGEHSDGSGDVVIVGEAGGGEVAGGGAYGGGSGLLPRCGVGGGTAGANGNRRAVAERLLRRPFQAPRTSAGGALGEGGGAVAARATAGGGTRGRGLGVRTTGREAPQQQQRITAAFQRFAFTSSK